MSSFYSLRPATANDARTIHKLVIEAGINPTGLKWPRFVVATPGPFAYHDEIIACGQIKPHADGSHELASIVVSPPWQGKGIARAIIEHLLVTHPGEIYLMCRSSLGSFYEKFGFQTIVEDEMPTYFRRIKRLTRIAEMVMSGGEFLLVMCRRVG